MSSDTGWIKLKSIPAKFAEGSLMINTNDNQYIIIHARAHGKKYIKYDTLKDDFSEHIKIITERRLDLRNSDTICCTYNDKHRMLLIYNIDTHKLGVIDINTNKLKILSNDIYLLRAKMVSIEDKVHILSEGGYREDPDHCIFDIKTSEIIHEETNINRLYQLIALKSERSLLALNGDEMYEYKINKKTWTESQIVSGLKDRSFVSCATTKDSKYIIFFGNALATSNNIMIWIRDQQRLVQSKVQCPMTARFNATLIYDDRRDELLTFGFINACFRFPEFENFRKLPYYLIQLIKKWISIEYVHLIFHQHKFMGHGVKFNCPENNHWKINVDHLLTSIV